MKKLRAPEPSDKQRLILSVRRWRVYNRYGRAMGRGLTEAELAQRVARETGASRDQVRLALKLED